MLLFLTFLLILPLNADRKPSFRTTFSCFKCTHHDKPQEMKEAACMKKFDLSKYTQDECQSENGPGKCLKSYEKTEARTKKQIEDDERSVTTRKCVSQGELDYLKNIRNVDTTDGCHTIRSTKTKHKGQINDVDEAAQQKYHFVQATNTNGPKRYLSNSNKSVFNLKWKPPGAKQNPIQSEQIYMPNPNPGYAVAHAPVEYYYPYAHPPEATKKKQLPKKTRQQPVNDTVKKPIGIKQSEKAANLYSSNKLKIQHYYADSPDEAKRLINELRQKGFVETDIKVQERDPDDN
ncbi:unnamed protein product [Rotaria socialis]|uniref:Uncharacterized protein n=1 Tax=Rotaria socialis TaxID=392032 RepID=A0A821DGG3_9BILA|nr:unnamed protein product [Rotaria socialis]CAF4285613.1 unnamed protein product [Rotaria socialis]CAF4621286.1 unnamed protein product [Rotaria socialis]